MRSAMVAGLLLLGLAMPSNALIAPLVIYFGGTAVFANALEMSALTIGSIIAFVKFNSASSTGAITGNSPDIVAQLAPDAPLPTPDGYTDSDGSAGSGGRPVPPHGNAEGQVLLYCQWLTDDNTCMQTNATASCQARTAQFGGWSLHSVDYSDPSSPNCIGGRSADENVGMSHVGSVMGCASGQQPLQSGLCSDDTPDKFAVKWPARDGKCFIVRNGNSFEYSRQDPDCDHLPSNPPTIESGKIIGRDGAGRKVTISGRDDKGVDVEIADPVNQQTESSQIRTGPPTAGPNGPGETQVPVTGTGKGTTSGTGSLTCATPPCLNLDGLNQEVTQQSIKSSIEGMSKDTKAIKDAIDPSSVSSEAVALTAQKNQLDSAFSDRGNAMTNAVTVTNLGLGFSIPWPTGGCTDPSFAIPRANQHLVIPMCSHRDDVQLALNWLVAVWGALELLFIGSWCNAEGRGVVMWQIVTGLFGSLAGFLALYVGKKTAAAVAAIGVFATLAVALMAAINACIVEVAAMIGALPSAVAFGFWYFMPPVLPGVSACVLAARIAVALFHWNTYNLEMIQRA